ncbi:MAG TPA: hypothetical protein VG367_06920 [Mucilaginibacter sp.]|jgi:hypothetical protein|nr:hypothetical protein [Mucilaginibacter sp.]
MIVLTYIAIILGAALAVAYGVYFVVNYQLARAGNRDGQFISLVASLFGFGMTIAAVYLFLVDRLVAGM